MLPARRRDHRGRPEQRWGIRSSAGTPKAALPAVLPTAHRCHRQPTDAHDSRTTPTMVERHPRHPSQHPQQPTRHPSTPAPTAAPGRPKQRWGIRSSTGPPKAALPAVLSTTHRCHRQPTDAHDSRERRPRRSNGAHDAPASIQTHRHPQQHWTAQSSAGPPKATLGHPEQHWDVQSSAPRSALSVPPMPQTTHRCRRRPTDAHDGQTAPTTVKRRPRQPTRHPNTQAPTAAPGRPKQRWGTQSSTGPPKATLPAVLSTTHRYHRRLTNAHDSRTTPTTAQPAVPGPGERPSGAIMTPPVRPPRRALGRTRGEPPLIREKPAIPAKNTRRSNRGRPARERLRPVSRHLHPMSHNTCAPRENGAGRHASRAGGI